MPSMYQLQTTQTFDRDIKKLDSTIAKRIVAKIEFLAEHPELLSHSLAYMPKDLDGLQKYRIGDWRVLLWVDHNQKMITLYGVDDRGHVYRKIKR